MTLRAVEIALLLTGIARAQAIVPCPPKGLDEDAVSKLVAGHLPDSDIVQPIARCHVAFAPELTVLDRLEKAGATAPVLDAVFHDGLRLVTLAQAHREVAAREGRLQEIEESVNARRDRELAQLDSDYQVRRDSIVKVGPQGQFQSDATYQVRLREAAKAGDELDRAHQTDRAARTAKYAGEFERRAQLPRGQIAALKQRIYPTDPGELVFIDYVANDNRLKAKVDAEEYWFNIPNQQAEALYGRWNKAKAMQPYEEPRVETLAATPGITIVSAAPPARYLVDTFTGTIFPGVSRAAEEKLEADAAAAAAAEKKRRDDLAKRMNENSEVSRPPGALPPPRSAGLPPGSNIGPDARGKLMLARAREAMFGKPGAGTDMTSRIKDVIVNGFEQFDPSVPGTVGGVKLGGLKAIVKQQWVTPMYFRTETTFPSDKQITYVDGKAGWRLALRKFVTLSEVEADAEMLHSLWIPLMLSDLDPNRTVREIGNGRVEISDKIGNKVTMAFSPLTGLPVSLAYPSRTDTAPSIFEEVFSDWQESGGVRLPRKAIATRGGRHYVDVTITSFSMNQGLMPDQLSKQR